MNKTILLSLMLSLLTLSVSVSAKPQAVFIVEGSSLDNRASIKSIGSITSIYIAGGKLKSLMADNVNTSNLCLNGACINSFYSGGDESDPIFVNSPSNAISQSDILNWNTAFSWGNHAQAGYVTIEADPVFAAWNRHTGISITESQISDLKSYLTSESDPKVGALANGKWCKGTGAQVTCDVTPITDNSQLANGAGYLSAETLFLDKWAYLDSKPNSTANTTIDEILTAITNGTFLKSFTELDPLWSANYSALNTSWSRRDNSSYEYWNNATLNNLLNLINASWNENHADTLYAPIGTTGDNQTWNQQTADYLYYPIWNPGNFISDYAETDPIFMANFPYLDNKPNNTANFTVSSWIDEIFTTLHNGTFQTGSELTNSSEDVISAVNNYSYLNISVNASGTCEYVRNATERDLFTADVDTNTYPNVSTTDCGDGYAMRGVNNQTGAVTCTAIQDSGLAEWINMTVSEYSTTSSTAYTMMPQLSAILSPSSTYVVTCNLIISTASASTGLQLQINNTNSPLKANWIYNTQVSATTRTSYNSTSTTGPNTLNSTGSAGTNVEDTGFVQGYVVTGANPVGISFGMKSEVSSSKVVMNAGSYCRWTEIL